MLKIKIKKDTPKKNTTPVALVRICPKCGSRSVSSSTPVKNMQPFYKCSSCEFGGTLFPLVAKKTAEKMGRVLKPSNKVRRLLRRMLRHI